MSWVSSTHRKMDVNKARYSVAWIQLAKCRALVNTVVNIRIRYIDQVSE
jgi:hypothetical protein